MLFVHESVIEAPPARVFAFHERPEALRLLIPPWERVEVVQPPASLQPGTRVILKMKQGPLWITWVAEHTLYEKDVLFQDRMVRGPFARWLHTHRFLPSGTGTLLRDEVDCALPLGLPGALVRSRLSRMFEFRHAATRAAVIGRPA
jgi:ligand-binding SRPBCC domain-containing protein